MCVCVPPHYFEAYDMKVSFMPLFYELDRYDHQELSSKAFCISLSRSQFYSWLIEINVSSVVEFQR